MWHIRTFVPRNTYGVASLVYFGMRVFVFGAAGIFLIRQEWEMSFYTLLIALIMSVPSVLKRQYRLYLPFELDFSIVAFLFLTLYLGSFSNFYVIFPWWDKMLHFASGVLIGSLGFVLVYSLNEQQTKRLNLSPGFISFFAFCFSLASAVIWEIFEYAGDTWTGVPTMQGVGVGDTMGDLIVCTVGALGVSIMGFFWMRWRLHIPFTPRLLRDFKNASKQLTKQFMHKL